MQHLLLVRRRGPPCCRACMPLRPLPQQAASSAAVSMPPHLLCGKVHRILKENCALKGPPLHIRGVRSSRCWEYATIC